MSNGIHHINFVVSDLDAAIASWEQALGRPVTSRDRLFERGADIARFQLGNVWLVLVQPMRPDSGPGRYLAEHGEGFFLLSLGVASLAGEQQRLGDAWFSGPARTGLDGWQVRDLDPQRLFGARLQLCEEPADQA